MLWVRAKGARDVISQSLGKAGVILDEAIAYQTCPRPKTPTGAVKRFKEEGADFITFTSASTVECFLDLASPSPKADKIVTIGPVTSEAVEENGYRIDLEAKTTTSRIGRRRGETGEGVRWAWGRGVME